MAASARAQRYHSVKENSLRRDRPELNRVISYGCARYCQRGGGQLTFCVRGAGVWVPKVQLGGALGDKEGGGCVLAVGEWILQEHRNAALAALHVLQLLTGRLVFLVARLRHILVG